MKLFNKKQVVQKETNFSHIQKNIYESDIKKGVYRTVVFKEGNNDYYYEWDFDKYNEEEALEKSSKLFNERFV